jgi:transposase
MATAPFGRHGRTMNEIARQLGCDWHTVNDAVIAYGTPLVDDPDRIGHGTAVGLDKVLFARQGPLAHPGVVDLDRRCRQRTTARCDRRPLRCRSVPVIRGPAAGMVRADRLGGAGPVRAVAAHLRHRAALGVAGGGPIQLVKLANQRLDELRRRVPSETPGHRRRKHDRLNRPAASSRADERLEDRGRSRLLGLLDAGEPRGEVRTAWHAK